MIVLKKSKEVLPPGIIYVPYIMQEHTEESLKEYHEQMDIYEERHKCCPKCGSKEHSTTLVGYAFTDLKTYKNKNRCTCSKCGDVHITHDRVPDKQALRLKKLNRILGK